MQRAAITYHCNQRITAKDVLKRSWYVRVLGPSFMYLKFRCPQCRQEGEAFIEQGRWSEDLLREEALPPPRVG